MLVFARLRTLRPRLAMASDGILHPRLPRSSARSHDNRQPTTDNVTWPRGHLTAGDPFLGRGRCRVSKGTTAALQRDFARPTNADVLRRVPRLPASPLLGCHIRPPSIASETARPNSAAGFPPTRQGDVKHAASIESAKGDPRWSHGAHDLRPARQGRTERDGNPVCGEVFTLSCIGSPGFGDGSGDLHAIALDGQPDSSRRQKGGGTSIRGFRPHACIQATRRPSSTWHLKLNLPKW
ncbi:hypothetical protein BT67DRAFT_110865 [Trichocladium antarcticum]|uniref:Uncharacterized protein n=1 Tax=Trichocladium antarcticum TaxID=1450529 RepID=A0AAN6URN7_9PEZI|nr:hypothetical protein BT67DRAFT_110865 [Trichocladium antarcticum]